MCVYRRRSLSVIRASDCETGFCYRIEKIIRTRDRRQVVEERVRTLWWGSDFGESEPDVVYTHT